MPTYEYACKSCGQHLEVVQSFMDDALTECPACGGTLRKVFGNIGITFKGSGFYRTDNRSDGHKAKAASGASRDGAAAGRDGATAGRDGASAGEAKGARGDGAGSASKSEGSASSSSAANGSSSTKAPVAAAS